MTKKLGRHPTFSDEEKARAIKLLEDHTYKEVSDLTGMSISLLKEIFRKAGKKRKIEYSDEEKAKAIELLKTHSYKEVTTLTGMSKSFLQKILKEAGEKRIIYSNDKKYNDNQINEAIKLLKDHTYPEVAKITGISKSTLRTYYKKTGKQKYNNDDTIVDAILLLKEYEENNNFESIDTNSKLIIAAKKTLKNIGPA
jgi:DNA invertase Pin-like site-specific DNA recombinase